MNSESYARYLVTTLFKADESQEENGSVIMLTYMSQRQVPEADNTIKLGWITGQPQPASIVEEHTHEEDEIIILWGEHTPICSGE